MLVAPETVALAIEPVDVPYTVEASPSAGGEDVSCANVKENKAITACVQLKRAISC